jgi:membrane protein
MAEQKVSKNTRQSPWKLGGLGIAELGRRAYTEIDQDNVLDGAAALAYYFFFALFPMIMFLIAMLGIFGGQNLANMLVDQLTRMMPGTASSVVHETVRHALNNSGGGKLSLGVLLALWSATSGMVGMESALNNVFEVRETRSFIKARSIALGLTIANGIIVIIGMVLLLYGGTLADHFLGGHLALAWKIIQYPLAVAFLLLSYSTIYYFAPNIEHPHWEWVTPGSLVGVFLWLIASFALRVYLHFSNSYNATYGALGGVMILMLWFWITGLAVLIGGEFNSEIEKAAGANQKAAARTQQLDARRPAA